tara:strand:+ start:274 stop:1758 length:1485 start_codon:yes stop_codon:yes gene_type:complete
MFKILALIIFSKLLISDEVFGGYVLFTPQGGNAGGGNNNITSYLLDTDENIYNTWSHTNGAASMPYLHPGDEPGWENTLLYYPCRSENPTMTSGGVGGKVEIYDWNNVLLWSYELSNETYQHHHDIDVLPNGNILMVAWERKYQSDWAAYGRTSVNNSLGQMWSTAIFEIEPNLDTGDATIVWEWHLWDHLIQDRGPEFLATYGNISDHPELMDINCNNVGSNGGPGGNPNGDWIHVNAIDYNADLDQIVISSRHMGEIYIIDHSTTTEEAASHSGGNSGMGGDFLYRWGNPQNYGRGNSDDQILSAQHSVNWIPQGSAGQGNLILYNNRHSNNNSAALEFSTPINNNGTYNINNNEPYGPDSWTWLFQANFFSDVQSGAFRQPNGNTLVTVADDSFMFEVSYTGEVVWSYMVPGSNNMMVPRAQKYSYDYFDIVLGSGDYNLDGEVNILDIISTVNIILSPHNDYYESVDMNFDNVINILDIVALTNLVLGIG